MNLFKSVMTLAEQGICVDYCIIDQKLNGTASANGDRKTYTINIRDAWSFGDPIDDPMSFNDLEVGLKWGITRATRHLLHRI